MVSDYEAALMFTVTARHTLVFVILPAHVATVTNEAHTSV